MKIVQLIFHLGSGGAERFVVDLSNELAEQGHDVTLIMLRSKDVALFNFNCCFVSEKVKMVALGLPEGFHLKYIPIIEKAVTDENPDVVHAHLNLLPYLTRFMLRHRNIRYVHTIHNLAQVENPSFLQKLLCKYLYKKKFVTPVTISKLCDESFRQYYKLDVSIEIDNGRSVPVKSEKFSLVQDEMKKFKRPVFVHVARYSKEKNQSLMVNAFSQIDKPFTLLMLGANYENAPSVVQNHNENIHLLGAVTNVGDYLNCADVFCLSSLVEGMPISLIEAMACGLPSVCTPAGGIPDMLENSSAGIISRDFSLESYVSAINEYYVSDFDKNTICEIYKKRFSIEACAANYLKLYTR